jgi:hypothetical protein
VDSCNATTTFIRRVNSSAAWAFPPAARGGILGSLSAPRSAPRHAGTSIATYARSYARRFLVHPSSRCFVPSFRGSHPWPRCNSLGR